MRLRIQFRLSWMAIALLVFGGTVEIEAATPACFAVARLHYGGGGDWYSGPSMLPNLHNRLRRDLKLETCAQEKSVSLLDPELYRFPILFMTGHGQVTFSASEQRALRQYLLRGGLLFADDNFGMAESFRREMANLFPKLPLQPLSASHPLFHSHYSFPKGLPKIHQHDGHPATAFGISAEGRLLVLFTWESDLGNGWEDAGIHSDPPGLREQALQMGVNVVAYYLQGALSP